MGEFKAQPRSRMDETSWEMKESKLNTVYNCTYSYFCQKVNGRGVGSGVGNKLYTKSASRLSKKYFLTLRSQMRGGQQFAFQMTLYINVYILKVGRCI